MLRGHKPKTLQQQDINPILWNKSFWANMWCVTGSLWFTVCPKDQYWTRARCEIVFNLLLVRPDQAHKLQHRRSRAFNQVPCLNTHVQYYNKNFTRCKVAAAKTKYVVISFMDGFSRVRFVVNEPELQRWLWM